MREGVAWVFWLGLVVCLGTIPPSEAPPPPPSLTSLDMAKTFFRGEDDLKESLDYGTIAELSSADLVDDVLGSGVSKGYVFEGDLKKAMASRSKYLWLPKSPARVSPGRVRWHPGPGAAIEAAGRSGKPVLLFQLLGRLDEALC